MNNSRWIDLMRSFGFSDNKLTFDLLFKAYSEKHRHYHTDSHIDACFIHLDKVLNLAEQPQEIELALWFHDAIYKPFSSTNEGDSAIWVQKFLIENHANSGVIERVYQLIMATLHNDPVTGKDQALMVDIDLSILGSPAPVYQIFEDNIRKEYKRVPAFIYRKKRIAILQSFINQDSIYHMPYFIDLFESQARINIKEAILKLY